MKPLTIMLEPETHTWLVEAARRTGAFPDSYVEELVERERRRDEASRKQVRHIDGDPRNNTPSSLELRERRETTGEQK